MNENLKIFKEWLYSLDYSDSPEEESLLNVIIDKFEELNLNE